jgi:hypothetical protein
LIRFFALQGWSAAQRGCYGYRVAGHRLLSDVPLRLLSAYACAPPGVDLQRVAPPVIAGDAAEVSAEGWLAGAIRRVVCRSGRGARELLLPGLGRFRLGKADGGIFCVGAEPALAAEVLEEALLGPPLTLALAERAVWCLHASAVLRGARVLLFLGPSGQGKSTLAAHAVADPGAGFERVADDIVPCTLEGGWPCARLHFPQLKLETSQQYPLAARESLPLGAVVVLEPVGGIKEISLERLAPASALKALAEQTVAVKLFDRALHRAHLDFLAALLRSVAVYRMRYPHDYARLPEVYRVLPELQEPAGNAAKPGLPTR